MAVKVSLSAIAALAQWQQKSRNPISPCRWWLNARANWMTGNAYTTRIIPVCHELP